MLADDLLAGSTDWLTKQDAAAQVAKESYVTAVLDQIIFPLVVRVNAEVELL